MTGRHPLRVSEYDELIVRIREAIELCLEVQGEAPEPLDFVGVQRVWLQSAALIETARACVSPLPL